MFLGYNVQLKAIKDRHGRLAAVSQHQHSPIALTGYWQMKSNTPEVPGGRASALLPRKVPGPAGLHTPFSAPCSGPVFGPESKLKLVVVFFLGGGGMGGCFVLFCCFSNVPD